MLQRGNQSKDDERRAMNNEILIYESGNHTIEVRLDGTQETLWLSLQQMADLFESDKSVISRHLRNIFKDEELGRDSVVAKNATTAADGKTYQVDYYNLDAIIGLELHLWFWSKYLLKDSVFYVSPAFGHVAVVFQGFIYLNYKLLIDVFTTEHFVQQFVAVPN